ncbi:MAG TPA: electron transfer flavoprotein subunit alpha/FixB family protein [Bacteroidia bacterium]|jgi:electron transfer flavoprotein alpha subunit|nr:electron transfer flavoprotein subunit alpha/FixB family protein [Bacteroidia bacterium]
MSVLVFAETWDGKFKKPSFEAATYAFELAQKTGGAVTAVVLGNVADDELKKLGEYGCAHILHINNDKLSSFSASAYTIAVAEAATKATAKYIVFSYTYTGKSIAPRLAARLKGGLVANATTLPASAEPFVIKKKCFSGKGFTDVQVSSDIKIIGLSPNSHHIATNATTATIDVFAPAIPDTAFDTKVTEVKKTSGKIVLTEAELVVSAGRGMKGPENWGMIEALADALGAATACSKPVADMDWRPHHEHVGQTGITISPNLYIAIGISGAIQHLAGISSSKVIVAINSDKEAPFFKIADYGIVGDAFQVVPKLTEAVKKLKSSH